jgi:hypothetical protein
VAQPHLVWSQGEGQAQPMPPKRPSPGRMLPVRAPEWEPLLNLAPDHVDDFMWMFAVRLKAGTRLQAYKHYWTRNYLHLDSEGRAFVHVAKERYEEVEPGWLLSRVLREDLLERASDSFVRHNYVVEEVELTWARAATRHRISRERSRYVVEHCGLWFWRRPLRRSPFFDGRDDRVLFFGDDAEGAALEVIAVDTTEEEFLVIHAMELRDRNRGLYEEARGWRR